MIHLLMTFVVMRASTTASHSLSGQCSTESHHELECKFEDSYKLGCRVYWVAVKELKLSYHNGYIHSK